MRFFGKNGAFLPPLLVFVAAACILLRIGPAVPASTRASPRAPLTIVLDAGHGGIDGGTTGRSGTVEKNINLTLTLHLAAFLRFMGVPTALTREDDRSLHSEGALTVRQQKREDLSRRLAFTREQERPVYIGIHQNFYQDRQSRGTQTFYSPNHPGSQKLAGLLQTRVVELLQPNNKRFPALSPPGVLLLKELTCPAIIVECGFLSNPEEEILLSTPPYQAKMAFSLAAGILSLTEDLFSDTIE